MQLLWFRSDEGGELEYVGNEWIIHLHELPKELFFHFMTLRSWLFILRLIGLIHAQVEFKDLVGFQDCVTQGV